MSVAEIRGDILTIHGEANKIVLGSVQQIGDGCRAQDFTIEGEKGKTENGAICYIDPWKSFEVCRITDDSIFTEAVTSGSGRLVTEDPDHNLSIIEIASESVAAGGFTVKYGGKDTINWWIAGPEGLTIIEVYNPHFTKDTEAVVADDDSSVSPRFWEAYHRFKKQAAEHAERYTLN